MPHETAEYLTEREVATWLRVHPRTVRAWRSAGYLRAVRLPSRGLGRGRIIRYAAAEVDRFMRRLEGV